MSEARKGNPLVEAVREGVAALRGERRLKGAHVRVEKPPRYGARDIARLRREKLGASQPAFAAAIGVSASTVRAWEQGHRKPSLLARRMLQIVEREPERIREFLSK